MRFIQRDMDFEPRVAASGQHIARSADITLATADEFQFDFDAPDYGFDLGPSDGIGSQDFEELDLGLDFGDGPAASAPEQVRAISEDADADDTMEVEVGRDAHFVRPIRESLGSHLLGERRDDLELLSHRSREGSHLDDFGPDIGDMEIDLGLDFGDQPFVAEQQPPDEQPEQPAEQPSVEQPIGQAFELPFEHEMTPRLTPSRACE